jgi:hypothetical protein
MGKLPVGKIKTKYVSGRDPGGFIALPWSVVDSVAYRNLNHPARSLLIEITRQYVRDNNGRLRTSMKYLATRGWKSADVVNRAKQELLAAGLIYETVKGHRPNRASWYAITWQTLDWHNDYDFGARENFKKGDYRDPLCLVHPKASVSGSVVSATGMVPKHEKTESLLRATVQAAL